MNDYLKGATTEMLFPYQASGLMSPTMIKLLLAIGLAALTFCIIVLVFGSLRKGEVRARDRLKKITKMSRVSEEAAPSEGKEEDQRFSFIKVSDDFRMLLLAAGVRFKPQEFIILWGASVLIVPIIALILFQNILAIVAGLILGFALPYLYIKRSRKKRLRAFGNQLGDALLIMSNCLRSGFTFRYAMERVSEDLPDPISNEFARVIREVNLGMPMEESLANLAQRMENDDLKLVNSAVSIQQRAGGNIADIIDKVAATIRTRLQIQNNVKTMTAQGRYSGILIGFLPIGLLLIFTIMSPKYVSVLYSTSFGNILLGVAAVLEALGFFVINKMTNVQY